MGTKAGIAGLAKTACCLIGNMGSFFLPCRTQSLGSLNQPDNPIPSIIVELVTKCIERLSEKCDCRLPEWSMARNGIFLSHELS